MPSPSPFATADLQRMSAAYADLARQTRDLESAAADPHVAAMVEQAIDVREAVRNAYQFESWFKGVGLTGFRGQIAVIVIVDRVRNVPSLPAAVNGVPLVLRELDQKAMRYAAGAIDMVGAMGIDAWSDADLLAFRAMAHRLGLNPADLLLVLYSESALKPSAAARNADGYPVAVGLNQITPVAATALGMTEDQRLDMVNWSVAGQLPFVERSLSLSGVTRYDLPDAGALYVGNFAPARLARGFGGLVVLYDSKKDPDAYASNKVLDREKKGWINAENMRQVLRTNAARPDFKAALERYQQVTGDSAVPRILPPPEGASSGPSAWWLVAGAAVVGLGVWRWRKGKSAPASTRRTWLPPPPGVVMLPPAVPATER